MEKRKFMVDRSCWLHGEPDDSAMYRAEDGKFCCLGFMAMQLFGKSKEEMDSHVGPANVGISHKELPEFVKPPRSLEYHTKLCLEIISTNDNDELLKEERESKLTQLFSSIGFDIEFTGNYDYEDD